MAACRRGLPGACSRSIEVRLRRRIWSLGRARSGAMPNFSSMEDAGFDGYVDEDRFGRIWASAAPSAVPAHAGPSDRPSGYIYQRYQQPMIPNSTGAFFRCSGRGQGRRTAWIDSYCDTAAIKGLAD